MSSLQIQSTTCSDVAFPWTAACPPSLAPRSGDVFMAQLEKRATSPVFAQEPRRDDVKSVVAVRVLHKDAEARNERRCSGYSRNDTTESCSEFTGEDSSSQVLTTKKLKELYLETLSPKEHKAYLIAKNHLGMSFTLEKSVGFLEWKKTFVSGDSA